MEVQKSRWKCCNPCGPTNPWSLSPKAGETKFSMETNWLSPEVTKNSRSQTLRHMNFHRTLHWGLILLVIPECNQDCIVIDLVFSFSFYKHISKASLHFQNFTGCRFLLSHCPQRTAAACIFALSSGSLSCRRDWKGLSVHRRTPSHGVYVFFSIFGAKCFVDFFEKPNNWTYEISEWLLGIRTDKWYYQTDNPLSHVEKYVVPGASGTWWGRQGGPNFREVISFLAHDPGLF